jgi:hypothetical protein
MDSPHPVMSSSTVALTPHPSPAALLQLLSPRPFPCSLPIGTLSAVAVLGMPLQPQSSPSPFPSRPDLLAPLVVSHCFRHPPFSSSFTLSYRTQHLSPRSDQRDRRLCYGMLGLHPSRHTPRPRPHLIRLSYSHLSPHPLSPLFSDPVALMHLSSALIASSIIVVCIQGTTHATVTFEAMHPTHGDFDPQTHGR